MRKFNELDYTEQKEIAALFYNWLKDYSEEVIKYVLPKTDEILSNDMAMMMIRELKEREEKENSELFNDIRHMMEDYDTWSKHSLRNNCLTHAGSYRNVLYDMYIRPMHNNK